MTIELRLFHSGDSDDFRRLNLAWLEPDFGLEDKDRRLLENPQSEVLNSGGRILIAERYGEVIGSSVLQPHDYERLWVELTMMTVAEDCRGETLGEFLLRFAFDHAEDMGAELMWAELSRKQTAANRLYQRCGFEEMRAIGPKALRHRRADIRLERTIG